MEKSGRAWAGGFSSSNPMATEPPVKNEELSRALKELPELKQSSSPPKEFWPRLLVCLANLSLASKGVLLLKDSAQQPPTWRKIGAAVQYADSGSTCGPVNAYGPVC